MSEIVEKALACYRICLDRAATYTYELAGSHEVCTYLQRLRACAEVCRAMAHVAMVDPLSAITLANACAEICDNRAQSADAISDVSACANICRACAEACRRR